MSWGFKVTGRRDLAEKIEKAFHEGRHGTPEQMRLKEVQNPDAPPGTMMMVKYGLDLNEPTHRMLDIHLRSARALAAAQVRENPPEITIESSGHINDDGSGSSSLSISVAN